MPSPAKPDEEVISRKRAVPFLNYLIVFLTLALCLVIASLLAYFFNHILVHGTDASPWTIGIFATCLASILWGFAPVLRRLFGMVKLDFF